MSDDTPARAERVPDPPELGLLPDEQEDAHEDAGESRPPDGFEPL